MPNSLLHPVSMHRASDIEELKSWSDPPDFSSPVIKKLLRAAWKRAFGKLCPLCKCVMHFDLDHQHHRHFATIDHIIARGLGGTNHLYNIQVLCKKCNGRKSIYEYHQMSH